MKLILTTAFASLLAIGVSAAQATTGNELLANLENEERIYRQGFAMGFILAVTESFRGFGLAKTCLVIPSGMSHGQIKDVVKKF